MAMSHDKFLKDIRLIVDLEDEVNRVHDGMHERDWVKDRITNLRFLYRHLEQVWWPIVPGHGTEFEGGSHADHQSEE